MDTERGRPSARRGQALMELAVGMFALALVVSALAGFAVYIAKSLCLVKIKVGLRNYNYGHDSVMHRN